ncbi:MAG TPA: hypothetical protein VD931_01440 [Baekduia sp.]|nr:hypothetical protein [Baekduia sp.]
MAGPSAHAHPQAPPRPHLGRREHRRLGRLLHDAQRAGRCAEPLARQYPELTAGDAYEIRDELVRRRLAGGDRLVGATVGRGPGGDLVHGWLTDAMVRPGGGVLGPGARPAVAVTVAWPPAGGDPLAGARGARRCVELVGPRTHDMVDVMAANRCIEAVVLDAAAPSPAELAAVREPLQWLAARCTGADARLAGVLAAEPQLVLVVSGAPAPEAGA